MLRNGERCAICAHQERCAICAHQRKVDGSNLHMCKTFWKHCGDYFFSIGEGFFDGRWSIRNTKLMLSEDYSR